MGWSVIGLWLGLAVAAPPATQVDVAKGRSAWTFDVDFRRHAGKPDHLHFVLPAEPLREAVQQRPTFPRRKVAEAAARAVRAIAVPEDVVLKVTVKPKGVVHITVSGAPRRVLKRTLKQAEAVRDEAWAEAARAEGYTTLRGGDWAPDHLADIVAAAPLLGPMAASVNEGIRGQRDLAARAVSVVQGLRYESSKPGKDTYRRPLSTLALQKGDCDAKVALYLALLRAADPTLDTAVVYIKGHALAALDLDPRPEDATLKVGGDRWVLVEPVGPAPRRLGEVDKGSLRPLRTGWKQVRVVPSGP